MTSSQVRYETVTGRFLAENPGSANDLVRSMERLDFLAFPAPEVLTYWESRPHFVAEVDAIVTAREKDELIGFGSYRRLAVGPHNVLYFDTLTVHPDKQGLGIGVKILGGLVLEALFSGIGECWRVCRTQNPAVAQLWISLAETSRAVKVHPFCQNAVPDAVASVARGVIRNLGESDEQLDATTLVQRGAFKALGGPVSPTAVSAAANPQLREFFEKHLDVNAGDALILVVPA